VLKEVRAFEKYFQSQGRTIRTYDSSALRKDGAIFFLMREGYKRKLVMIYSPEELGKVQEHFVGEEEGKLVESKSVLNYKVCPCDSNNATQLRRQFPFTSPQVMGLTPAIGCGDRIGLATPGHIHATSSYRIFPVLAQQSIREMARTSRSPQDVIDDVSWAVFQEGYQGGFGADADHLKTERDVEDTFGAGFTMYTIDPSEYVDDKANSYGLRTLKERFAKLPWNDLGCDGKEFPSIYLGKEFEITSKDEGRILKLAFSEEDLLRAAVKYSAAIAHTTRLKRRLDQLFNGRIYDLELSVDETSEPTSLLEHLFIALELRRLNIKVQGLALRFAGRFEKAIDYIGDTAEFEITFQHHVRIARRFGPYKLSIHSGSDKFSIYPILGRYARDVIHVKTAGTSYLESLRIIARHDPSLFRKIVCYGIGHFERDRKTYQTSARISMLPDIEKVPDDELERTYIDGDHGRQILHVTFGSVLTARTRQGRWLFREQIKKVLIDNEEEFYDVISEHLERHFKALGLADREVKEAPKPP